MEAFQIICTYKKKSLFSKGGFKTIGISNEIESSERKEIENRASQEMMKLDEDFKDYMSFYMLASGKYCICKITKDFLHGFIAKEGMFNFYPIQLFSSGSFINDITNFDIKKFGIIELPNINEFLLNDKLEFDYISEFIKGKTGITLRDMINVLLLYNSDKKFLIINDRIKNIHYWIGALQMAFPIHMAHEISFTTSGNIYENDGYTIVSSSILNSDDIPQYIKERSYFFDLSNYIKSSIDSHNKFNRVVDYGYLVSKESIYSFHEFLNKFDYMNINEKIEYIYNFYNIISLGIGNMDNETLMSTIKFCDEFLIDEYNEEIIEKMSLIFDKISREVNITTLKILLEFIFKRIGSIKNLILIDKIYKLLFRCIDNILFDCERIEKNDISDIYDVYIYLVSISGERAEGIRKIFVNTENVDYITYRLIENGKLDEHYIYFKIVMENLVTLQSTWNDVDTNEKYKHFFGLCINKTLENLAYVEELLSLLLDSEEIFLEILALYYDNWTGTQKNVVFSNIFSGIVKNIENEKMLNIRRKLYSIYGGDFLFNEYKFGITIADDKKIYFNEYYKWVVFEIPEYGKIYYSSVIEEYININKENMLKEDYVDIIYSIYNSKYEMEIEVLRDLIQEIENYMDIKQPEIQEEKTLNILNRIKKEKDIQTNPDITSYVNYGMILSNYYEEKDSYCLKDILKDKIKIEGLDKKQYNQYLTWCIPKMIYFVRSLEDHRTIAYTFKISDMDKEYFDIYLGCINELINKDIQRGYSILLSFIVYFFFYLEPQYRYMEENDLLKKVFDDMLKNIVLLPKDQINKIDNDVKEEFINEGLSIPIQWTELYNRIK